MENDFNSREGTQNDAERGEVQGAEDGAQIYDRGSDRRYSTSRGLRVYERGYRDSSRRVEQTETRRFEEVIDDTNLVLKLKMTMMTIIIMKMLTMRCPVIINHVSVVLRFSI